MTTYTVAITSEAEGPTAQSTDDLDAALDWFGNACDSVLSPDEDVQFTSISVGGVVWGMVREGGLAQDDGGEVVELKARRVA